jgi:hypothetical protein
MSRTESPPQEPKPQLNWVGQILVALVLIAGLLVSTYAGLMIGLITGLDRAATDLNAPPGKGVGLAPDLTPLMDATADVVIGFVGGIVGGLVVGGVLGWLAYRFLLKRLALAIPGLRRRPESLTTPTS